MIKWTSLGVHSRRQQIRRRARQLGRGHHVSSWTGYRRAFVGDVSIPPPERARRRYLEGQHRRVAARGRIGLADRLLRPGHQVDVLGNPAACADV